VEYSAYQIINLLCCYGIYLIIEKKRIINVGIYYEGTIEKIIDDYLVFYYLVHFHSYLIFMLKKINLIKYNKGIKDS
jgi:hypothetical protein